MKFYGIQKLSLVDFDTEVSCTLFARGCNMRCPFCHNFELVVFNEDFSEAIPDDDIKNYLILHNNRLSAVVITGGEPTLDPTLEEMCDYCKGLGYKVKLDTNGTNPQIIKRLIEKGLIDYIAVDIKNSKEEYSKTIGVKDFDTTPIEETVRYLTHHDFPYEFRTTLVNELHTNESIESMGKWLEGANVLYLQHFVSSEFVPDKSLTEVPTKNALEMRRILEKYVRNVNLRGY